MIVFVIIYLCLVCVGYELYLYDMLHDRDSFPNSGPQDQGVGQYPNMPDYVLISCYCMLVVGSGIVPSYRLKDTDDDYRLKDTDDDYRLKDTDGIVWYVV